MITKLLNELNEKNQELNELLSNKDYFKNLEERIEEVNKRNESLKDEVMTMRKLYFEIRDRNYKAREFIKENCLTFTEWEEVEIGSSIYIQPKGKIKYKALRKNKVKEVLEILKGVDK